jgi:imidazolonepropionase-like amidohydrolase
LLRSEAQLNSCHFCDPTTLVSSAVRERGERERMIPFAAAFAVALVACMWSCRATAAPDAVPRMTAFLDVTVIAMDRDALSHQTVLVEEDRVVAIGPSDIFTRIPSRARRIIGTGRFLMPGLIDMHVHFRRTPAPGDTAYSQQPDYQEYNDNSGILFVANGVTSVRVLNGHPVVDELVVRSRGNWLGPSVYSSGQITDGDPPVHPFNRIVTKPEDAARMVAEDKEKGYIAVKVYDNLTPDVYEAIVKSAATLRIDVVGHIPIEVGVARVIAAHQATIEHAESFLYPLQRDNPPKSVWSERSWEESYRQVDLSRLTPWADELRRAGIWTCPTMIVNEVNAPDYERRPEMKYIRPAFRAALHEHWPPEPYQEGKDFGLAVVRRLHDRGAGLLLGSDTYVVVPGFSALQELALFVEAGLSPYEALQTGTVNAARALHLEATIGAVEVGKRADLLLLNADPRVDVANISKRVGVMLRGRWLPETELQSSLAAVAQRVAKPLN